MSAKIRYGTVLRCFDAGPDALDRYTILPPRWAQQYRERAPHLWQCIGVTAAGLYEWTQATPGKHLGARLQWKTLPPAVQQVARQSFPEFTPN